MTPIGWFYAALQGHFSIASSKTKSKENLYHRGHREKTRRSQR